jgi:protocatechuate 3,4-dioxygenase beta subunit
MRTMILAAVLSAGAAIVAAQQRDSTQRNVPVGTAVLAGQTVTTDDPARPLRRVLVTLSGAEIRGDRQVMSDDEGHFAFEGLVAGRYTLTAEKPAYVTIHHGSPRPGYGPGAPVAIADAQTVQVVLRVPRGAVIAGVIRTPDGQPIASAQAQLSRVQSVGGQLRIVAVPGVRTNIATDDKGRFRYFGLPPGEYVIRGLGGGPTGDVQLTTEAELDAAARTVAQVARTGPAPFATPLPAPPIPRVRYVGMYAPHSVDVEGAQRFRVGLGQEILDVDITVALARTAHVSGVSIGPGGEPQPNAMISLVNTRSRSLWTSPGGVRPDAEGRFKVLGLPEGEWALIGRAAEAASAQGPMVLFAETPFTMTGDDVPNLSLSFQRGSAVSGRIEITGGGAIPAGLRLGLTPVGAIAGSAAAPTAESPHANGTFAFAGVAPGRYRLTATGAANLTLRSALLGDVDTLDGSFDVAAREDVTGMRVVLTSQPTQLTGTLLDGLGRPAPEYAVVVFSTDRGHWTTAPRRMTGLVKLDSRGSYRISGLPPGTYYLSAVTDAEPSELADPAFLEQLMAVSLTFTLKEGEVKVQDIKMR